MNEKEELMVRPYIICHMVTSIDGKVTGSFLRQAGCRAAEEHYYQINRDLHAEAYACGRVTMEESFTGGWYPDLTPFADASAERKDHVADPLAGRCAVAFDRRGRLGWKGPRIEDEDPGYGNAHIVEVLCEEGPTDAYLAYLQSIGVSYLFAGKQELDLALALQKLRDLFSIKTLLLEGGSEINGAFLRAGAVDELSLVQAPLIAGGADKSLFDRSEIMEFELRSADVLDSGALWLRYRNEKTPHDME